MSGYATLLGHCGECGGLFTSNPAHVPSVRQPDGSQLIFCRTCVEAANPERIKRGLQPIVPHPLAYEPGQVE